MGHIDASPSPPHTCEARVFYWATCQPPERLLGVARDAEACGYDGVAIADHIITVESGGKPDSRLVGRSFLSPLAAIAAMSGVTDRLRFLTSVLVLPLRDPIETAQIAATIATISSGRLLLGVAGGWYREEFEAIGANFDARADRLDEQVEILLGLIAEDSGPFDGRYYSVPACRLGFSPSHPVPLYFGGRSPHALRRAASWGSGWVAPPAPPQEVHNCVERLHNMRSTGPRADEKLDIVVRLPRQAGLSAVPDLIAAGATTLLVEPQVVSGGTQDLSEYELQRGIDDIRSAMC